MHKREEHVRELQRKEEEMRQMFVVRVKEKEAELKEAEKEVRHYVKTQHSTWRHDHVVFLLQLHAKFEALNKKHTQDKNRIEDQRQQLDKDVANFQQRKASALQSATLGKKRKWRHNRHGWPRDVIQLPYLGVLRKQLFV